MARFVRKRKDTKRHGPHGRPASDEPDADETAAANSGNKVVTEQAVPAEPESSSTDDSADAATPLQSEPSEDTPDTSDVTPTLDVTDADASVAPEVSEPEADAAETPAAPDADAAETAAASDADAAETAASDADAAETPAASDADAAETPAASDADASDAASDVRRTVRRRRRGGDGDKKPGEPRRSPDKATSGRGSENQRGNAGKQTQKQSNKKPAAERDQDREDRVRSQMLVHVDDDKIHVAILEGRTLVEHYVTHRNATSIAGNIYLGKVQNVLPGMEAAFVDIGTAKNAVLYSGDVRYVAEETNGKSPRIEDILSVGQAVLVQVVKDPMGSKGARLTTEISLPGRFLVLVPEDDSTGISRRLPDDERTRLRDALRKLRPEGFGIIVRTAAEGTTEEQLKLDLDRLETLWHESYTTATRANPPTLIYEEPELVIRTVRETFSAEFRRLIVDDKDVYERIVAYLSDFDTDLVERVQHYEDDMTLFRRYHVTEQIKQGLARKVWLPSGGSLVFDFGEALTVIDVNTAKNVGSDSLEQTVFENNLEAADEIARQLRLRDIGGIIVIDFIDMEIKKNRDGVLKAFKGAVGRDKTKTQVYDISDLGLVEMTRKNVSEGLLESFSQVCSECQGTGHLIQDELLP